MKIANKEASKYTSKLIEFKANNIFAESNAGIYAVYSYGYHFPMYIFSKGIWYRNSDTYSITTSRHQSQSAPFNHKFYYNSKIIDKTTEEMIEILNYF